MRNLLFPLLLFSSICGAVEYQFDLGEITATGEVTSYPAGLGWLSNNQFSASALAVENRSYRFNNELLSSEASTISLRPISFSSGLGRSWGGWSLLVNSSDQAYSGKLESASQSSDFTLQINSLTGQLGCGLKLNPQWALGWSLLVGQVNTDLISAHVTQPLVFSLNRQQSKTQFFQMGIGADFRGELITVGFHLLSPNWVLSTIGKSRTQSLVASTDSMTDTTIDYLYSPPMLWSEEIGIRFGRDGFVYTLSDNYQFNGQHTFKGGFEYVASWGTVASGTLFSRFNSMTRQKILVGFARKKENFHWAVGPFLERESYETTSGTNSQNYGVLYSSEIAY